MKRAALLLVALPLIGLTPAAHAFISRDAATVMAWGIGMAERACIDGGGKTIWDDINNAVPPYDSIAHAQAKQAYWTTAGVTANSDAVGYTCVNAGNVSFSVIWAQGGNVCRKVAGAAVSCAAVPVLLSNGPD